MTTDHPNKSRKPLTMIILLGVGIAAAAMLYQQISAPDRTDTSAGPSDSMIGGSTDEVSAAGRQVRPDGDAAGEPELAERSEAAAADADGPQNDKTGGVLSGDAEQRAGYTSGDEDAEMIAGKDILGAQAVPKRAVDQGGGGGSVEAVPAETDAEPTPDTEEGPDPEPEKEEPPPPPFEGNWSGRMEPGVATTTNGQFNCGGADITKFRLLYNNFQDNYVVLGTVLSDLGALGRNRRWFFSIRGLVSTDGVFNKAESWALDKRAELGNYEVKMSGVFSLTQAIGSYQDSLGCSGTWSMRKQ